MAMNSLFKIKFISRSTYSINITEQNLLHEIAQLMNLNLN